MSCRGTPWRLLWFPKKCCALCKHECGFANDGARFPGLLGELGRQDSKPLEFRLQAWARMLRLTEDEDDMVRKNAARSLGHGLASVSGDVAFATIDYVQRQTFRALSRTHGHEPLFVQQLLDWIYRRGVSFQARPSELVTA